MGESNILNTTIVNLLKNKKFNTAKATSFGFQREANNYVYVTGIMDGQFKLTVTINDKERLSTQLLELANNNEYRLHLDPAATGSFVNSVKNEFNDVISSIVTECFDTDIFKTAQAKEVIQYLKETYHTSLEFLWKKFPEYAIVRRPDNKKWYALLMIVDGDKIGLKSNKKIEILDLRIEGDQLENIIDNQKFFPGYHMSKKSWYTVYLNETIPNNELFDLIDKSYALANK